MKVNASRIAGVSLAKAGQRSKGSWVNKAIGAAALVASFFGIFGMGVSLVLERQRNARVAKQQKQVLAEYYRVPVARQLGIHPDQVNLRDLEMAAQVNPMIANAIAKVDREKTQADRSSLMVNGGAMAAGAALGGIGILPGASGVVSGVAHGTGMLAGAVAGGAASSMMNKDVLETADVVERINSKRSEGQAVAAQDVFMLRLAQDEALQKQVKQQAGGKPFHKMDAAQQQAVMQSMPEMLAAAQADAEKLNSGADEASVIMQMPEAAPAPQAGGWAARVGGSKAVQGSYASRVQAERALAQQGVMAPGV